MARKQNTNGAVAEKPEMGWILRYKDYAARLNPSSLDILDQAKLVALQEIITSSNDIFTPVESFIDDIVRHYLYFSIAPDNNAELTKYIEERFDEFQRDVADMERFTDNFRRQHLSIAALESSAAEPEAEAVPQKHRQRPAKKHRMRNTANGKKAA